MEQNNQIVLRKEDFVEDGDNLFMSIKDLAQCLGFKQSNTLWQLYNRNKQELDKFSTIRKIRTVDGKDRDVMFVNEMGCYTIAMFANTERAKEFRSQLANLIMELRKGNLELVPKKVYDDLLVENKYWKMQYFKISEKVYVSKTKGLNQTKAKIIEKLNALGLNYPEIAEICDTKSFIAFSHIKNTTAAKQAEKEFGNPDFRKGANYERDKLVERSGGDPRLKSRDNHD